MIRSHSIEYSESGKCCLAFVQLLLEQRRQLLLGASAGHGSAPMRGAKHSKQNRRCSELMRGGAVPQEHGIGRIAFEGLTGASVRCRMLDDGCMLHIV